MEQNKPMNDNLKTVTLDRRKFSALGIALSSASYLAFIDDVFADNHCTKIDIKNDQSPIGIFDDMIYYWIDGQQAQSNSNIAFYLHFKQNPDDYIERVVLTTAEKKTLGARYFDPDAANSKGYAPYMIFNGIDLRFSKRYFLIVQVKSGELIKIYRYTLDSSKLKQSKLSLESLPAEMMIEFKDKHAGQCYASYYFQVQTVREEICNEIGLSLPCYSSLFPFPKILSISENSQFRIEVVNNYRDVDSSNYMRYFFLTDPCTRPLAIHKRSFGDKKESNINLFTLSSSFWQSRWGIESEKIPRINDCPYLLLFAENPKYGIFYSHIWLR